MKTLVKLEKLQMAENILYSAMKDQENLLVKLMQSLPINERSKKLLLDSITAAILVYEKHNKPLVTLGTDYTLSGDYILGTRTLDVKISLL